MYAGYHILLNSNDTQFLSKVNQKVGVKDIDWSPVTVNIGGNDLALSFETLRTHGVNGAL